MKRKLFLLIMLSYFFMLKGYTVTYAQEQICDGWKYKLIEDGTVELTGYEGVYKDRQCVIPAELNGYKVSRLNCDFKGTNGLDKVIVSEGIMDIFNMVIIDASAKEVVIPSTVQNISNVSIGASFKNFTVSSANQTYKSYQGVLYSYDMKELVMVPDGDEYLTIPEGVEKIGFNVSGNGLVSLTTPKSLKTITHNAFSDPWNELKTVTIKSPNCVIEEEAFKDCLKLEQVTLDCKIIGKGVFSGCKQLKKITMSNHVQKIGNDAFWDCGKLKNIKLSKNLKTLGSYAFMGCKGLKTITIPDKVTKISDCAFTDCVNIEKITVGKKITIIGDYAFDNCKNLKVIIIKSHKLKKLGKHAFNKIHRKVKFKIMDCKGMSASSKGKMVERYKKLFSKANK